MSLNKRAQTFTTGNKRLRCALFMGAISAIRTDPECRALHQRLVAKGRSSKVGIVAAMNKTMRRVAAVANRGTPWVAA